MADSADSVTCAYQCPPRGYSLLGAASTAGCCFKYWPGHLGGPARLWTLHVRNRIRTLSAAMSPDQYAGCGGGVAVAARQRRAWHGREAARCGRSERLPPVTRRPCPPPPPALRLPPSPALPAVYVRSVCISENIASPGDAYLAQAFDPIRGQPAVFIGRLSGWICLTLGRATGGRAGGGRPKNAGRLRRLCRRPTRDESCQPPLPLAHQWITSTRRATLYLDNQLGLFRRIDELLAVEISCLCAAAIGREL